MLKARRTGTALTVIPNTSQRSPERQALADAITEREQRKAVHAARQAFHATLWDKRAPYYVEMEQIEAQLREPDKLQADRINALARGEDPDTFPTVASLRARLAELEHKAAEEKAADEVVKKQVEELAQRVVWAEIFVTDSIKAVLAAEPVLTELAAEYRRLSFRRDLVAQALSRVFGPGGGALPTSHFTYSAISDALPPCPWTAAAERLKDDPDAVVPTLAEGLALIELSPDQAA